MQSERVVVIGSGPAGAMAARELVRRGLPVTMLESGTASPRGFLVRAGGRNVFRRGVEAELHDDDYVATGNPSTDWCYHLAPGGLTNQWTGAVPRFAPRDFDEGERLDERYVWPVTYDELAPFYDDAESLLQITGGARDVPGLPGGHVDHTRRLPADWQAVRRVAAARGQGFAPMPYADGPRWLIARRGTAFNSFTRIVQPLAASGRFELRTGAHAVSIEWSGAQRRVVGVLYHDRARGHIERLPATAVVVACGALNSTKLLFSSACPDFPDGLGNTEGLLGQYLHDHPREWWTFETDAPLRRLAPASYLTRRPYEVSRPLLASSWTVGNASPRDKVLSFTPLKAAVFGVQVFGTMIPTPKGYVRPSPVRQDEFGVSQLEICIDFDGETITNMVEARQHFLSLMEDAGHRCRLNPVVPQLTPGRAVHYGGTARMHRCREHGVLDEWNRPFDIPNLVVSDSSCFTTNTEKNPTLTLMALSARAARRLAHDLKDS
jgi:choline dehydrogenase-like flavoprotein